MCRKALKGFLVYQKRPIQKTHDLIVLLKLCEKLDADFDDILFPTNALLGLDVEYRYVDDDEDSDVELNEPNESQARNALDYAKEILDFVKEKCV